MTHQTLLENRLIPLLFGLRLDMMQCCQLKSTFNKQEFKDNVKFQQIIIGT